MKGSRQIIYLDINLINFSTFQPFPFSTQISLLSSYEFFLQLLNHQHHRTLFSALLTLLWFLHRKSLLLGDFVVQSSLDVILIVLQSNQQHSTSLQSVCVIFCSLCFIKSIVVKQEKFTCKLLIRAKTRENIYKFMI